MHFLIFFILWPVVSTESTHPQKNVDAVTISKGQRHVVKELEILKPVRKELSCTISDIPNKPPNITGYWRLNGAEISNTSETVPRANEQYTLKREFDIQSLGNYSCIFINSGGEDQATFAIKVPAIKERDKPIVSYIGDTVVLECHFKHEAAADTWKWFRANGTEREYLNATTVDQMKYNIVSGNDTKLTVKNLSTDDAGNYFCVAMFSVGSSEARVELNVLSFTEPLKPFIAIAVEVVILITLILLYEKHSHSRKKDSDTTENGPQSEQATKLTQDESNGTDGGTTTRQRKVEP